FHGDGTPPPGELRTRSAPGEPARLPFGTQGVPQRGGTRRVARPRRICPPAHHRETGSATGPEATARDHARNGFGTMRHVPQGLRRQVTERAGNCCEYCHLPAVGQVGRFPVDHVIPRSSGGPTDLANLALACPACNGHKWAHMTAFDPVTGETVPLFNPRT